MAWPGQKPEEGLWDTTEAGRTGANGERPWCQGRMASPGKGRCIPYHVKANTAGKTRLRFPRTHAMAQNGDTEAGQALLATLCLLPGDLSTLCLCLGCAGLHASAPGSRQAPEPGTLDPPRPQDPPPTTETQGHPSAAQAHHPSGRSAQASREGLGCHGNSAWPPSWDLQRTGQLTR